MYKLKFTNITKIITSKNQLLGIVSPFFDGVTLIDNNYKIRSYKDYWRSYEINKAELWSLYYQYKFELLVDNLGIGGP
ncbi:12818_t:CDS:2 [Funneliformis caledonium]|uniref:12818_t:CDS:1 n=1 Tax=Funneliformis caledonium TaxID=1117310 RepID=A0A9N8VFC5_9GLOM|nr:12818_t:CDS:2 [Funneliformis caledonium]